jgi:hypothetical protein
MLAVPFRTQHELAGCGRTDDGTGWAHRACAIACLTMVLEFHGQPRAMAEVLEAGLGRSAFDPRRGWLHTGLVDVLQACGLHAYRRNWRLLDGAEDRYLAGRPRTAATLREVAAVKAQMLEEGLRTLGRLVTAGVPVITSVHRPWGARATIGHQIVVVGTDGDDVVHHDPAEPDGAYSRVSHAVFAASWKGLAIVAGPSYPQ